MGIYRGSLKGVGSVRSIAWLKGDDSEHQVRVQVKVNGVSPPRPTPPTQRKHWRGNMLNDNITVQRKNNAPCSEVQNQSAPKQQKNWRMTENSLLITSYQHNSRNKAMLGEWLTIISMRSWSGEWICIILFTWYIQKCDFIPPKRMTHLKSHKYGEFVQYLTHKKNESYIYRKFYFTAIRDWTNNNGASTCKTR